MMKCKMSKSRPGCHQQWPAGQLKSFLDYVFYLTYFLGLTCAQSIFVGPYNRKNEHLQVLKSWKDRKRYPKTFSWHFKADAFGTTFLCSYRTAVISAPVLNKLMNLDCFENVIGVNVDKCCKRLLWLKSVLISTPEVVRLISRVFNQGQFLAPQPIKTNRSNVCKCWQICLLKEMLNAAVRGTSYFVQFTVCTIYRPSADLLSKYRHWPLKKKACHCPGFLNGLC